MPSTLQDRIRALREAREAKAAASPAPVKEPAAEPAPKPAKKERPPLYTTVDRRWKKLSEEESAMFDDQADAILERAAKTPFTLKKALSNYPQPVLRHLCVREKVPVPHSTVRGQRPRAVFVEALCSWFEQRAMTAEAQEMAVHRRPGKKSEPEPEPTPPEPEPESDAGEDEPASPTPEEIAEQQAQDYERDCAEIMAGNNSIVLWRRVQQTLRSLVKDGTLTQKDADAELKQLKGARA